MISLHNDFLNVQIQKIGAQLTSVLGLQNNISYIWAGDATVWGNHAPNLFPSIGQSFEDTYFYEGQKWTMPRHGFIQTAVFEVVEQATNFVCLQFKSNEDTLKIYPFDFILQISFELKASQIIQTFKVHNLTNKTMSFALGGHPAFTCPLTTDTVFEDYFLSFNIDNLKHQELQPPFRTGNWLPLTSLQNGILPLTRGLFDNDSILLDASNIDYVILQSVKTKHFVRVDLQDFPYLCLWTKQDAKASYICLEPFLGMHDGLKSSNLLEKEGNRLLAANEIASYRFDMSFQ
jgi:galactose mutarotase-like enzyme